MSHVTVRPGLYQFVTPLECDFAAPIASQCPAYKKQVKALIPFII